MDSTTIITVALLMAAGAALYSSVGHGGASAYLAIMALFSVAPEVMRPTALALNLIVSGIGVVSYGLKRQINPKLLFSFAVTAVPGAFLGGTITLEPELYRPLVGVILWAAAVRLFWQPGRLVERSVRPPSLSIALPVGLILGLLAGLTGTGGGIFLSPLIILFAWEDPRRTSGVAAGFIFLNSVAGLAGNASALESLPTELPIMVVAVIAGAALGTWLGVERLPRQHLLRSLGLVLALAGFKLIFT